MNTPKYKLLVFTNLSETCNIALENAVNLAKIINGSIDVFHVLKPSNVAEYENQFSAMRHIDEERMNKKIELKTLVRNISKKAGIKINASSVLGNFKDEAKEQIEKINPDIVVLGKRTPKLFGFLGDDFTKFILNTFNGSVLISGKEKIMNTAEAMSLGMFNTTADELAVEITTDLRKHTKNPIKQFFLRTETNEQLETAAPKNKNIITFEFDSSTNTIDNIATYVAKNNIGLLCMKSTTKQSTGLFQSFTSTIKQAIQKINAPILIINNNASIQLQ